MKIRNLTLGFGLAVTSVFAQSQPSTEVVCSYAPSQSALVNKISSEIGGAGLGAEAILKAAGMTAVRHSSGSYIFTHAGGYVAGSLGSAITAPVLITASIVVAGAAVALELTCAPRNHPDAIKKVEALTADFNKALHEANDRAIDIRDATGAKIIKLNNQGIDVRDAAVDKVRAANEKGIEFRDGALKYFSGRF